MRRQAVTAMTGLSAAALGLGLHASSSTQHAALSAAPTGVQRPTDTSPIPPTSRSSQRSTAAPTPRPSRAAAVPRTAVTTRPAAARPAMPRPVTSPTSARRSVTVNGAPADTQYGPVQVQITITNGRIVHADAIDYPQGGGRDQEINSQAVPKLNQETLQAQSAQIDTVSGATYTSGGYQQSLQSALDAAHKG